MVEDDKFKQSRRSFLGGVLGAATIGTEIDTLSKGSPLDERMGGGWEINLKQDEGIIEAAIYPEEGPPLSQIAEDMETIFKGGETPERFSKIPYESLESLDTEDPLYKLLNPYTSGSEVRLGDEELRRMDSQLQELEGEFSLEEAQEFDREKLHPVESYVIDGKNVVQIHGLDSQPTLSTETAFGDSHYTGNHFDAWSDGRKVRIHFHNENLGLKDVLSPADYSGVNGREDYDDLDRDAQALYDIYRAVPLSKSLGDIKFG
ncbi:MAG: hypothetical protein H8Z69_00145 [Nanohaloarchaea archaeon]|nr:hypothetical protein [Candidatus Nanohaloarchaea archaeon]